MLEVTDETLSLRGRSAIRRHVPIVISDLQVIVSCGHVTLRGHAELPFLKSRAEKVVRELAGVTGVTNEITVQPSVWARPDRVAWRGQRPLCSTYESRRAASVGGTR